MKAIADTYTALSHAVVPPGGDASAFAELGLASPRADALEREHVQLFGRAGRRVVSPYEGDRHPAGLHRLLATYAEAGLAPDATFRDRPDHVSVELAFMGCLVGREAEARTRGDAARAAGPAREARDFFVQHVRPWIPPLFEEMAHAERFPLHRGLAASAATFLRREHDRFFAERASTPARAAPAEARCETCGQPAGFSVPRIERAAPTSRITCFRCRLRVDMRRTSS